MEQLVLGVFKEQLSKFIVGFRKEQVNANLLNGKGVISDIELNCQELNKITEKLSPLIELEYVHISKLSFHVTSWTNIKQAPICVDIEHVTAHVKEPLEQYTPPDAAATIRQLTQKQLKQLIKQGILPPQRTASYNLLDRILDNLTIEVSSVQVALQTIGKFKTRRNGPWQPPTVWMHLSNIRIASVNEYGQEASPDEVWRHNKRNNAGSSRRDQSLLIYKRCVMEYQISLQPAGATPEKIPLVTSGHENQRMEVQMAIQRRVRDGEVLAVQIDATIPTVEIRLNQTAIPHLAHAVAGLWYCINKDRAFTDPLRSETDQGEQKDTNTEQHQPSFVTIDGDGGGDDADDDNQSGAEIAVDLDDDAASVVSGGGETFDGQDDGSVSTANSKPSPNKAATAMLPRYPSQVSAEDRPVIVLPNGMCIHEKISLSVSLYEVAFRGNYGSVQQHEQQHPESIEVDANGSSPRSPPSQNEMGYFEVISKGCIMEAIWPKTTLEKGGYVQASVSYFRVEERSNDQTKTLALGGFHFDSTSLLEGVPLSSMGEVGRDENFPLYEDRGIRPDPLGLRHTFPAQAFGLKTTVDFLPSSDIGDGLDEKEDDINPDADEELIRVLHEIGVDQVDFVLETESLCRILSFLVNEEAGGFDPRWHTGDWSRLFTPDMMVSPSEPLVLEDCLQHTKQIFLDDNEFISSDLFNLTARITGVTTKIPASLQNDVKACNISMALDESMIIVSSALPRTIISGRIGKSLPGKDGGESFIEFPNDASDVLYDLEKAEDPSNRQRGVDTSRAISTFRFQATLRGVSIKFEPVIKYYSAVGRDFLSPCEVTMVFCFEGEPPESEDSDLTKMAVFLSVLLQQHEVNLDIDLLAAALSTLLHHGSTMKQRLPEIAQIVQESFLDLKERTETDDVEEDKEPNANPDTQRIPKTLKGRQALVRRQFSNSHETGGISVAIALQISTLRTLFWRQHALITKSDSGEFSVPALCLLDCTIHDFEAGFEGVLRRDDRRVIAKSCFSSMDLHACDMEKLMSFLVDQTTTLDTALAVPSSAYLQRIAKLGDSKDSQSQYGFACRLEETFDANRGWAAALDIPNGAITYANPEAVEMFATQLVEALLMPYSHGVDDMDSSGGVFPAGTVGAMFESFIPAASSSFLDLDISAAIERTLSKGPNKKLGLPEELDRFIKRMIDEKVPESVDAILLRSCAKEMTFELAPKGNATVSYHLTAHDTDFAAAYFKNEVSSSATILQTMASTGEKWNSVFGSHEKGLHHRLKSRQSVLKSQSTEGDSAYLVSPFNSSYEYSQSKVRITLDEGVEICGEDQLDDLVFCVLDVGRRSKDVMDSLLLLSLSLQEIQPVDPQAPAMPTRDAAKSPSPAQAVSSDSTPAIRSARDSMVELQGGLQEYSNSVQGLFRNMQLEMDTLRFAAFRKEKERLAAHAVAASQQSGWIRFGNSSRSGQRGALTSTLWPYWAVLRKGIILFYNSPGKIQLIDTVSLDGAALYELSGGQRRRDLKRAFGLLQSDGTVSLMSVSTDREYDIWVSEMKRSIKAYGGSAMTEEQMSVLSRGMPSGLTDRFDSNTVEEDEAALSQHETSDTNQQAGGRIGRGFSRAVDLAKSTRQAVTRGSFRQDETGSDELLTADTVVSDTTSERSAADESSTDQSNPIRRPQIRNRFAGMGQATRLAMSKAREKGRAVVTNALPVRDSSPFQDDRASVGNSSIEEEVVETNGSVRSASPSTEMASSEHGEAMSTTAEDSVAAGGETRTGVGRRLGTAVINRARQTIRAIPGQQDTANTGFGAPSVLKLRDIVLTGPLKEVVGETESEQDESMKRLDGKWFVRVKIAGAEASENPNATSAKILIEVFSGDGSSSLISAVPQGQLIKDYSEIYALHTSISECMGRIRAPAAYPKDKNDKSFASINALEAVRTTAILLDALIEVPQNNSNGTRKMSLTDYHVDVIAEFLNSMINIELPVDGLSSLTQFLELANVSTQSDPQNAEPPQGVVERRSRLEREFDDTKKMMGQLLSASKTCQAGLVHAERRILADERSVVVPAGGTPQSQPSPGGTIGTSTVHAAIVNSEIAAPIASSQLNKAVHEALMNVMAERDEANSKLAAEEVIHVQRLAQQKKKASILELELEELRSPGDEDSKRRQQRLQHMQSSSDEEMMSLCQQLSNEILARSNSDLEMERIKTMRDRERANDAAEMEALRDEVRRLKQQLEETRR